MNTSTLVVVASTTDRHDLDAVCAYIADEASMQGPRRHESDMA